jgi:hypothetical protein
MESDMDIPKAEAPVAQWTRIEFTVKGMDRTLNELATRLREVEILANASKIDILTLQLSEKARESLEKGITSALDRQASARWSPFARMMTVIAGMSAVLTIVILIMTRTGH